MTKTWMGWIIILLAFFILFNQSHHRAKHTEFQGELRDWWEEQVSERWGAVEASLLQNVEALKQRLKTFKDTIDLEAERADLARIKFRKEVEADKKVLNAMVEEHKSVLQDMKDVMWAIELPPEAEYRILFRNKLRRLEEWRHYHPEK